MWTSEYVKKKRVRSCSLGSLWLGQTNQELMMFVSLSVTDFRLQLQFQWGMPLLGMSDRQLTSVQIF